MPVSLFRCFKSFLVIALVPATTFLGLAPAAHGATYSASTSNGGSFSNSTGVSSTGEVGLINLPNNAVGSQSEYAAASQAGLKARSQVTIDSANLPGLGSGLLGASATASGSWGDFVISGPAGEVVVGGINLVLDGSFATGALQSNNWGYSNSSSISVSLSGSVAGQGFAGGYEQTKNGYTGGIGATSSGIFGTSGAIPVNPTTPMFTVMANTPFTVSLQLTAGASGYFSVGASSGADPKTLNIFSLADFSNTLTFATGGPVFNLPEGYTVTSLEAGISNNQYIVPLPAAVWLFGSGLLGLIAMARKRSK